MEKIYTKGLYSTRGNPVTAQIVVTMDYKTITIRNNTVSVHKIAWYVDGILCGTVGKLCTEDSVLIESRRMIGFVQGLINEIATEPNKAFDDEMKELFD